MKYLFVFLFLCVQVQAQYLGLSSRLPGPDSLSMVGKVNVFIGDSETFGFGLSDTTKRWSNIFSKFRGATEYNIASNGKYLQYASICTGAYNRLDKTTVPTYVEGTHGILVVAIGVNDLALNTVYGAIPTTPHKFGLTLDTAIDYWMTTKLWPSYRIVVVTPFYWPDYSIHNSLTNCGHVAADAALHQQYVDKAIQVAMLRKCKYVDAYTAIKNDVSNTTYFQADNLHYNNTGNIAIANLLKPIMY